MSTEKGNGRTKRLIEKMDPNLTANPLLIKGNVKKKTTLFLNKMTTGYMTQTPALCVY